MVQIHPKVSRSLKDIYDRYYLDDRQNDWRTLCAKYKARHIVNVCSDISHYRILDIGAGDGAVADMLGRMGFGNELYCIEISSSGVEQIRARNITGLVEVKEFDGYEINYPDDYFDLAFATHVLEHVEHERIFLQEAARVCKYLFIEVPLEDTNRLAPDFQASAVGHINYYNYRTIRRLVQSTGLAVLDQKLFDTPFEVHRFQVGAIGLLKYVIRRSAFVMPKLASRYFTYHCSLLCTSA